MNTTISHARALFHTLLLPALLLICILACSGDDDEEAHPTLSITAITPATARAGESIVIAGMGFNEKRSQNNVSFKTEGGGTVDAKVMTASATSLTVTVPEGAYNGTITVTVNRKSTVSEESFTIDTSLGAPTLTSIDPSHGLVNATLTIKGTNFGTDKSVVKVLFGTTEATEIITVINTAITVKVPVSLKPGEVDVKMRREAMESSGSLRFTVDKNPVGVKAMYWGAGNMLLRGRITAEGAKIDTLYNSIEFSSASGVEIDEAGGFIYWNCRHKIMRAPLDGSGPLEVLYETAGNNGLLFNGIELVIDPASETLYTIGATRTGPEYIHKGSMKGSSVAPLTTLYTFADRPNVFDLELQGNKLYWIEYTSRKVMHGDVNGGEAVLLYGETRGIIQPVGLTMDDQDNLYITNQNFADGISKSQILKAKSDGSSIITLIEAKDQSFLYNPKDIEIDIENGYLVWLDQTRDDTIGIAYRVKLDGSGAEKIFDGFYIANKFDLEIGE